MEIKYELGQEVFCLEGEGIKKGVIEEFKANEGGVVYLVNLRVHDERYYGEEDVFGSFGNAKFNLIDRVKKEYEEKIKKIEELENGN